MSTEHRRSRRWLRFITLLLAIALAVGVAVPPGGVAPTAAAPLDEGGALEVAAALDEEALELAARGDEDPGRPVSARREGVRAAEAREWTLEEMRAAKPVPMPVANGRGAGARAAGAAPPGPPGGVPGRPPEQVGHTDPDNLVFGPATTVVPFLQYKQYPTSTVGRLFFKKPGSNDGFTCSGASIGGNAVWTAGHCVFTPGKGWHTDMVFMPSFFFGWSLRGQWVEFDLLTVSGWQRGDVRYDYGAVILRPFNANSKANAGERGLKGQHGRRISQVVGELGIAWNQPLGMGYTLLGYPEEPDERMTGNTMWSCSIRTFRFDTRKSAPRPVGGAPCDQGEGSSGGPWIMWGRNWLGGNQSYTNASFPRHVFSPQFTRDSRAFDTTDFRDAVIAE